MFPEGTRSPDGRLRAFKHGAFTLALRGGHPILPILVEGTAQALPKRGFVLQGRHAIRIRVLDEIPHAKLLGRPVEDVTREVWQLFADALGAERVASVEHAKRAVQ
jgi:1-acyl-sn-glycerol-3-phosphate acyltransferase